MNDYYSGIGVAIHPINGINRNDELFEISKTSPLNNYRSDFRIAIRGGIYENQNGFDINIEDSVNLTINQVYKNVLHLIPKVHSI